MAVAERKSQVSKQRQSKLNLGLRAWTTRHIYSFFSSIGTLLRSPLGTFMTVAVLGIAMALPLGLWVALKNLQQVNPATESISTISVFLNAGVNSAQVDKLATEISAWPEVENLNALSPEAALADFRQNSGFAAAVDALADNPLPWVFELKLQSAEAGFRSQQIEKFLTRLETLPNIDFAQYDLKWLERLQAIMSLGGTIAQILVILFGLAVIFVVGNTIRLDIQNRREEIEVMSLVGATEAFIRRPFLYTGFWYGLLGGLVAISLVGVALGLIKSPLQRLLVSYQSQFELLTPGLSGSLLVLLGGGVLGLFGAALAVRRHLQHLNPA